MRRSILPVLTVAAVLAASVAQAAPTCQDRSGVTTRCGTANAMPVGWTLPPGDRLRSDDGALSLRQLASLIAAVGGLLALFALMPAFDGWDDGESDENEGH